jgi:phosphatidylserine/phosphatidylglycerophosphate/cardiolipin synthase-like enzyme
MTTPEFDQILRKTLEDFRVSRGERRVLSSILDELDADEQQLAYLRNRAFEIAREQIVGPEVQGVINWLEDIVKVLQPGREEPQRSEIAEVHFSPGDRCVGAINGLIRRTHRTLDVCVFTITDNRISETILEAANRRVKVRIITDDEKSEDKGSDIEHLQRSGIEVRVDHSPYHMHHKFAIFDRRTALTGSYNWTRSAAEQNEENIVVTDDRRITKIFVAQFEELWDKLK